MAPRYQIGQEIIVTPVAETAEAVRDSALEQYGGHRGKITDYHWITLKESEAFYLYTVQMEPGKEKIVLHEDELAPCIR